MTYRPRRRCRRCDRDRDACGGVSHSGLCRDCGPIVAAEALEQLHTRQGEHFDAYLEGLTGYVARLWGERLTPDNIAALAAQGSLEEAEAWLAG